MTTSVYHRHTQPENPLGALQQKARRQGFHLLRARNFAAFRGTTADLLGQVLIYDASGNQLAGPFDLEAADKWLASAALDRWIGRAS
jgi:hypothetical protein